MRKVLPWLAAEKPDVFNAYQQSQGPDAEKALMKAEILASFIAEENDKSVFVGLYSRKDWKRISKRQFWANPENALMKTFGYKGPKSLQRGTSCVWFDLTPMSVYRDWKGRLVVNWPPGRLWWRRCHSNMFTVYAIHEDNVLAKEMPPWDCLNIEWKDLSVLPRSWKDALKHWRGIYYIFDTRDGKGYVGSASGDENILGRWQNYASSGHGGNKKLKERDPSAFRFTILQRTSPDMTRDEICQLEVTWKDRLHSREYGLNDN